MEKDNLQEEKVVDDGRRPYNILNFQDFVLEEGKKDKKEAKKSKKLIKNRKEFIEDKEGDIIDPNTAPERYVKLREQFINEDYKRVLAGKQAPLLSIFPDSPPFKRGWFYYPQISN